MKKRSIASILGMLLILVLVTPVSAGVPAGGTTDTDPDPIDCAIPTGNAVNGILAPEAVTLVANPDLQPGCGIKVALVLDASGSIGSAQQTQVRAATNGFIAALSNTGSQVAIVEFAETADTPVAYTEVTPGSISSTFTPYVTTTYHNGRLGNCTNWEAAFVQVRSLAAPDLVVFMTDGQPNTVVGGTACATSASAATTAAATQADLIKGNTGNKGFGSHIFGVGVNMTTNGLNNLKQVLDGAASAIYTSSPSNFPQADYIVGTFDSLFTDLTNIVTELCKSSLTVIKKADNDGRGDAYYLEQAGFTFTGNLVVSPGDYTWISPGTVVGAGRSGVSGTNGQVFFQWQTTDANATASITVVETTQADFGLVDVACTGKGTPVYSGTTFAVNGLGKLDSATCTVRNRRLLFDFGDAPASYGTLLTNNGARHGGCSATPIYMGTVATDYEPDGIPAAPGAPAIGDDNNSTNDEGGSSSGITLPSSWQAGSQTFGIAANAAACLNVWMDWTNGTTVGGDGDFTDTGEQLITNQAVVAGSSSVPFTAPSGLVTSGGSSYYLRFRITPQGAGGTCSGATAYGGTASPVGVATCGEVTDLKVDLSPLAVDLASFIASVADDSVLVSWETVSELGNQGFNLYRSTSLTGPRTQLNGALIPSQVPGGVQGAGYDWTDSSDLVAGTTYYYWLEHVSMTGATTLGEPVSITFGAPTAVRLREFGASGNWPPLAWLGGLGLAALAAGALVRRRQQS